VQEVQFLQATWLLLNCHLLPTVPWSGYDFMSIAAVSKNIKVTLPIKLNPLYRAIAINLNLAAFKFKKQEGSPLSIDRMIFGVASI
jgi:hypothetical protein